MEDYEYKVSNLHAILSYDYQQIGNISKTTSKLTGESGSRRFLPREQQLFPGDASRCSRVWSSGVRAADALLGQLQCLDYLLSQVYYRAATPLPTVSPTFTESLPTFYRSFGLSWENSILDTRVSLTCNHLGSFARG